MPLDVLDVLALRRWVITARAALSEHAGTINALNVFPVPDRDTGTNMSVTMALAVDGLAAEAPPDLLTSVRVLARATLLSARGNSGVILSQLVRGLADVVIGLDGVPLTSSDVADVLREAAQRARGGVQEPVEGTMLSVADAAADAATGARGRPLAELVDLVVVAAQDAVGRTREQLPVLRDAGVVDAGAVGYWIVLRALQHVVHREPGTALEGETPQWLRAPQRECPTGFRAGSGSLHEAGGPAYEVMFVVHECDPDRIAQLTATLQGLGDSVVISGGPELCSVHVHLDDVAAGVNAAVAAGRPDRFQITRFADRRSGGISPRGSSPVLAVLASPGLVDLVHGSDPGADVVVAPDEQGLLDLLATRADRLVLADTPGLQDLAQHVVSAVVGSLVGGSQHPAQLLAALAVRAGVQGEAGEDQEQGGDDLSVVRDVCDEAAAAVATYTIQGGAGDALARCRGLLDRVVTADIELVTLIAGADAPDGLLDALAEHLTGTRPDLEVTSYAGGRPGVVLDLGCE